MAAYDSTAVLCDTSAQRSHHRRTAVRVLARGCTIVEVSSFHQARTYPVAIAMAFAMAVPLSLAAQRLSTDFRQAFERQVRPLRTYVVILKNGVPTTPIDNRDPGASNMIALVSGNGWRPAPTAGPPPQYDEFLQPGEILQLVRISYNENEIDLRMVSVDPHTSVRGWTKLVVTTFRVVVPVSGDEIADVDKVPAVVDAVQPLFRTFSDEREARAFAATLAKK